MPNLSGKATTERVRIWRRLQNVGAVAVRPAVYVLPAVEQHIETFQWLAREIIELGGQASLCEGSFIDGVTDDEIQRKFIEARQADYGAIGDEAREVGKSLRPKALTPAEILVIEAQLSKLKKRLREVIAIDFCHAPGREAATGALESLDRRLAVRRGPTREPEALPRATRPHGATWVTRRGVHVDRIACAWLIRRFVDGEAKLKFVSPKGYLPELGELRFDMYEAEFTHVGDRCSFEVIVERMGVDDPAVVPIGEIVHDLDVRDDKFGRPELAGVASQITGVCAAHPDDLARIAAAAPIFDALHAFFSISIRSSKKGSEP